MGEIQAIIPGTERDDRIDEIDQAALAWREAIEEKDRAEAAIEQARASIHAAMIEHQVEKYVVEDGDWVRIVTYQTKGSVRMRRPKRDEADE